ncbi:MAG: hypothetical protein Q9162_000960 [Coniocarpon cinnabarinum]
MSSDTLIVGISGVSSCGKTTLARLLRDVFPQSCILHEDDFYWPDSQIPMKNGMQDWDCFEAIDSSKLSSCLHYIKRNGSPPRDLESKEDLNSVGECDVDPQVIKTCASRISAHSSTPTTVFIDGFLLYSQQLKNVRDLLDVKLFLRTNYQTTKARREARSGYVTLEGFWKDPPGYVDQIVWPNYVKDHSFLFENGNVESSYNLDACEEHGIIPVPDSLQQSMAATLEWACSTILEVARSRPS